MKTLSVLTFQTTAVTFYTTRFNIQNSPFYNIECTYYGFRMILGKSEISVWSLQWKRSFISCEIGTEFLNIIQMKFMLQVAEPTAGYLRYVSSDTKYPLFLSPLLYVVKWNGPTEL